MSKILITGSQGFIGSYLCAEFLSKGYKVVGVDNFSKYGPIARPHDNHPNFHLIEMDVIDFDANNILPELQDVEYIISGAAMIGGITYFHKYASSIKGYSLTRLVLEGFLLYFLKGSGKRRPREVPPHAASRFPSPDSRSPQP